MSKIDLIIHFIVKVKRDDIFALASQLAYYLVLSFFPFLMFLFTLIGFINLDSTTVLEALQTILPITVFELVETIILEIVDSQNTGLLGVSVLLAVWTASSGFRAVIKGVNKAYNLHENRNYIRRAIMSFLSIIALAITLGLIISQDSIIPTAAGINISGIISIRNTAVFLTSAILTILKCRHKNIITKP